MSLSQVLHLKKQIIIQIDSVYLIICMVIMLVVFNHSHCSFLKCDKSNLLFKMSDFDLRSEELVFINMAIYQINIYYLIVFRQQFIRSILDYQGPIHKQGR